MPLETTKFSSAKSLFLELFFSIEQVFLATAKEQPLNVAGQPGEHTMKHSLCQGAIHQPVCHLLLLGDTPRVRG